MESHFRSATGVLAAIAAAIGFGVVAPAPASAALSYCAASGSCPVFAGPDSAYYYAEIPNLTATQMICWTDAQWYSVNYSSNRWFKVSTPYTSTTWMHSSEVYNQITVSHC